MMPQPSVTPNSDQSPAPQSPAPQSPAADAKYVFAICQHGAEPALKKRWIGPDQPFRLAFSRPGLLTFKIESPAHPVVLEHGAPKPAVGGENGVEQDFAEVVPPEDFLIRQSGFGFGNVRGEHAEELARQAIELAGADWDAVHVFARDPGIPGERGFEPGPTELTDAVLEIFTKLLPNADTSGGVCEPNARVLDIVLIEPDQWLVGHHIAAKKHQQWPGGVYPLSVPSEIVSRAYLKISEGLAWSGLPIKPGDRIVEIGSSPGGACQRLLDLGLRVTGVDPAEMDPLILEHPRFEHFRTKAAGVKRRAYSRYRWLAADANVAPNYTLAVIEDIVTYPTSRFEGLLLTLKLSSYELAEELHTWVDRVRSWGFEHVGVRQLSRNRRECCLAALRGEDWTPPPRPKPFRPKRPARTPRGENAGPTKPNAAQPNAPAPNAAEPNPS